MDELLRSPQIMSVTKLASIGTIGSILAFVLAFCGYPLMLFGTKMVASALWYLALTSALIFCLVLLCSLLMSVWRAATGKGSPAPLVFPLVILVLVFIAWWRFFAFLETMP